MLTLREIETVNDVDVVFEFYKENASDISRGPLFSNARVKGELLRVLLYPGTFFARVLYDDAKVVGVIMARLGTGYLTGIPQVSDSMLYVDPDNRSTPVLKKFREGMDQLEEWAKSNGAEIVWFSVGEDFVDMLKKRGCSVQSTVLKYEVH